LSSITSKYSETLPDIIRQSFFLKDQTEITPDIVSAFQIGLAQNNFSVLEKLIRQYRNDEFNIYLTHDIDWLNPQHPYSIIKFFRSFLVPGNKWYDFTTLVHKDSLLRNIEKLIRFEVRHNLSSAFFLGANNRLLSLGRYDIRYSIKDGLFTELIDLLKQYQIPVGLHSSYNASSKRLISCEKKRLEQYTDTLIHSHRSHFLNYDPDTLYSQLEVASIKYDFGAGAARAVRLTNHFPGKFKPIHAITNQIHNVTCIPLILMDNAFFFHKQKDVMNTVRQTLDLLQESKGSACILFHPENMLLKPELWDYYEEIIHLCKERNASISPKLI
jgi:hypothetical protein